MDSIDYVISISLFALLLGSSYPKLWTNSGMHFAYRPHSWINFFFLIFTLLWSQRPYIFIILFYKQFFEKGEK